MKRKLLSLCALFLLLVGLIIIAAPVLIESQKVQEQVLRRINNIYVIDARFDNLRFSWFPFPHLTARGVTVEHERFTATSPITTFYPTWKIVLGLTSLGRLHIVDPVFTLHSLATEDENELQAGLSGVPDVKLHIKNGSLVVPGLGGDLLASQPSRLHNISAFLAISGSGGNFSWESGASFAEKISLEGDVDQRGTLTLRGEITALRPQEILRMPSDKALLIPQTDSCNLNIQMDKTGDRLKLAMQGNLPDFALQRLGQQEMFQLGQGDISLTMPRSGGFSLWLNNLTVNSPSLQIQGEIARYLPVSVYAEEEAKVKIDLQATNIDLSAVRQKVLGLLADSAVARQVCDIVQGGRARSASYFFDAPVAAFEDVVAMTIAVDIAESDIHLADIPLDLHNAHGPILIKDGDLTGKDITTWVGDAKGSDGAFLVGLGEDNWGLQVDVDIDANLAELPGVLRTLLDDEDVVRELAMVEGKGRAHGHLHIGDDLRDFQVKVDVDSYDQAELRYERLSWPIRVEAGHLQVTGTSVAWNDMQARLASHTIHETSGQAAWLDETVPLEVRSVHGIFDANTLLGELRQYPVLAAALDGVLDTAQGSIELAGSLQGPFFEPEKYTYQFAATLRDIIFSTPALPERLRIETAKGTIGDQELQVVASSGTLFDHPIAVNGSLRHDHWASWQGNLQLSGILDHKHLRWLKDKVVFPALLVPKPPYRVETMAINWEEEAVNVSSTLFSSTEKTSVNLDIGHKENATAATVRLKGQEDQALFALHWPDADSFEMSFAGRLSGASLHDLLDVEGFDLGALRGDFRFGEKKQGKDEAVLFNFTGQLAATDLAWHWGEEQRQVAVPKLEVEGKGRRLDITKLELVSQGQSLTASGTLSSKPGHGYIDLDLVSPSTLTTPIIEAFQADLDYFLTTTLALEEEELELPDYALSGLLDFDIQTFVLPFDTKGSDGEQAPPYRLPFTPLRGSYQFDEADSSLNLKGSEVCGVGVNGQLSWHGPKEASKEISLMSPVDTPLDFKEFLHCFNFQGIIEGPLTISGRIQYDSKICKLGGLHISSEKGTIKKFVALAKILSLVNITGLSGAIWTEGFYYNALEVSGNICNNIFTIEKAFIDGDGVDIIAIGEINLSTMEYDLTFFVVPFSTINSLVTKVPLVGRVLGGKEGRIVSVPVKVTGPVDNPTVTVLSPSAIGEATGKWILDTITLPFGWMIPEKAPETEGQQEREKKPGPEVSDPGQDTLSPSTKENRE